MLNHIVAGRHTSYTRSYQHHQGSPFYYHIFFIIKNVLDKCLALSKIVYQINLLTQLSTKIK